MPKNQTQSVNTGLATPTHYNFIPIREAVKQLGDISLPTVYRLVKDGRLPPLERIGRKVGYFDDTLRNWREGQRTAPAKPVRP
jgi:predicted DNA-binding transcriptional regulator AlpA